MKKTQSTRIVEIEIHRSKRNPFYGHAIVTLFPCSHKKRLGICVFPSKDTTVNTLRVQSVDIIRIDNYEVTDKEPCRNCPTSEIDLEGLEFETEPSLNYGLVE